MNPGILQSRRARVVLPTPELPTTVISFPILIHSIRVPLAVFPCELCPHRARARSSSCANLKTGARQLDYRNRNDELVWGHVDPFSASRPRQVLVLGARSSPIFPCLRLGIRIGVLTLLQTRRTAGLGRWFLHQDRDPRIETTHATPGSRKNIDFLTAYGGAKAVLSRCELTWTGIFLRARSFRPVLLLSDDLNYRQDFNECIQKAGPGSVGWPSVWIPVT